MEQPQNCLWSIPQIGNRVYRIRSAEYSRLIGTGGCLTSDCRQPAGRSILPFPRNADGRSGRFEPKTSRGMSFQSGGARVPDALLSKKTRRTDMNSFWTKAIVVVMSLVVGGSAYGQQATSDLLRPVNISGHASSWLATRDREVSTQGQRTWPAGSPFQLGSRRRSQQNRFRIARTSARSLSVERSAKR